MAVLSVLGLIMLAQAIAPHKDIMGSVDAVGSLVQVNQTWHKRGKKLIRKGRKRIKVGKGRKTKHGRSSSLLSRVSVLVYGEAG